LQVSFKNLCLLMFTQIYAMKYLKSFVILMAISFIFSTSGVAQGILTTQAPLPCIDKEFTIVAHIVRDTFGNPNLTEEALAEAIDSLNADFAPICASFNVCEIRYIPNFQYDVLNDDEERAEMAAYYNVKERINMYFVTGADSPYCGVATLSGITQNDDVNPMITILKGDCMAPGSKTISHEMGHFFSLLHTFDGPPTGTQELVDGSNCTTTGDMICDTPADPYLEGTAAEDYVDPTNDCRFINMSKDGNGDWYVPDVGNIMSYYQSSCACGFTYGQYKRMADTYLNSDRSNW